MPEKKASKEELENKDAEKAPEKETKDSAEKEVKTGVDANAEQKKKKLKKSQKRAVIAIAAIIIICLIAFFALNYTSYLYSFPVDGLMYYSNEYTPTEFFNEFRNSKEIFVSPVLVEGKVDPLIANAMNLWLVVLNFSDVNAVQLIQVVDGSGQLTYCQTNHGDVLKSEQMPKEDCLAILADENKSIVLISIGSPKVILSQNRVAVSASSGDLGVVNFSVLKQLYPNSQDMLDIVNEKIYGISK